MAYILTVLSDVKKMTMKELRDFFYEHYYKQIRFTEENSYFLMKLKKLIKKT